MDLKVNGEHIQVPETVGCVGDLLQHFGLAGKVVIVELNENILQKEEQAKAGLSNGDRVEIVHFVGGG